MHHNFKTCAIAAMLLAGFPLATGSAMADGRRDCTSAPQASWKPQADVESAARAAGYEVRRSKVEGSCYEVYGIKDGRMYELFYDPVELKLLTMKTK